MGRSNRFPAKLWRVFVTVLIFLIICWPVEELTEETSSLRRNAEESFREWLRRILVRISATKKLNTKSDDSDFFFLLTIKCNRGGRANEKCPVQPSDLVLIHNYIMEALNKPDTDIHEDCDFWNAARQLKAPYLKFCNVYKSRLRIVSFPKMKVNQPRQR